MSAELDNARVYEKKHAAGIASRPVFHLTPPAGWMNDPNGFSFFHGKTHLFYQYYPYGTKWGDMHWGHAATSDFMKWEYLPVAMAPDTDYETGCYSGSAVEDDRFGLLIMYTAHKVHPDGHITEEQCAAASSDGISCNKLFGRPVIRTSDLPDFILPSDFRDPKLWHDETGYHALLTGMERSGNGALLRYDSRDMENWSYAGVLMESSAEKGGMWECPDIFSMGKNDVLTVSAMEMHEPPEITNISGHETFAWIGKYDAAQNVFRENKRQILDFGADFYAPQTIVLPDGRHVLTAWMNNWENVLVPENTGWAGMMCLPREITLKDGILCQAPVREIEKYETEKFSETLALHDTKASISGLRGRVQDVRLRISGDFRTFTIDMAENEKYVTKLIYDRVRNTLTLDRSRSGMKGDAIPVRYVSLSGRGDEAGAAHDPGDPLELRILMDIYSVEVFACGGSITLSSAVFTPRKADGFSLEADGSAAAEIKAFDIS
ncbi:MAG: glycoside hydrolase family 32 protein [Anaerovoracaceae bacterium]